MKTAAVLACLLALAVWAGNSADAASDGRSITTVNGSVRGSAGQAYDTLSTVNGSLRMEKGASANDAHTVNGEIELDDDVKVGQVNTVNGSVTIGRGAAVAREASTVNGSIKVAQRASVGGGVSTVSGDIELDGSEVAGMLKTVNGDIELRDGARVRGGILIKKPNRSGWGWSNNDPPEVRICGTCVVEGELRFERPVELNVEPGGKIGKVVGETVSRR
jgi:hypothetical protein